MTLSARSQAVPEVFAVGTLGVHGVRGAGSDLDFKTKNYGEKKDLKI